MNFLVLDDGGARLRFGAWPSPLPAWVAHRLCERLAPRGCQVEVMVCACVAASARALGAALGTRAHVVFERSQESRPPMIFECLSAREIDARKIPREDFWNNFGTFTVEFWNFSWLGAVFPVAADCMCFVCDFENLELSRRNFGISTEEFWNFHG